MASFLLLNHMPNQHIDPDKTFNAALIRQEFPAFSCEANNADNNTAPFVYLDNAATCQKPRCVINTLTQFYSGKTANVNRSNHQAALSTTLHYQAAREKVADFLHADVKGIIWTRGTTESINLVAYSFAKHHLTKNDEILISEMEHHANLIPWQLIAEETGATLVKIPMLPSCFNLDMDAFSTLLNNKTKLVAVGHVSNVTGTRHDIETIIEKSHAQGALVLVDGAQAISHEKIDLTKLDVDFYAFSGHKFFAPSGIGILYVKPTHLDKMPPWQGGGKIIEDVSFEKTHFLAGAAKFEAGTPNIAGALALATAINWFTQINLTHAQAHIALLQKKLVQGIRHIEGVRFLNEKNAAGIVSFIIDGVHHLDITTLLDEQNIAVRSGHLCAYPLMKALNIKGCIRISIALYNTENDIDLCIQSLQKACDLLQ